MSDNLFKYRPDQERDNHGRWTDEGGGGDDGTLYDRARGAKKPKGGKKPSRQESLASLVRQYKAVSAKRTAVDRRLSGLMRQASGLRRRSPAHKKIMARVRELQAQRTEFTRQIRQLTSRNPTLRERARAKKRDEPVALEEPTLFASVDKGADEFNEDQARGKDGKWIDGWGTSERTMRRRRQQARERREARANAKKPKGTGAKKPAAPKKPAPKPKAPPRKKPAAPKPAPKAPRAKPRSNVPARTNPPPAVIDAESTPLTPEPETSNVPSIAAEVESRMQQRELRQMDRLFAEYDAAEDRVDELRQQLTGLDEELTALDKELDKWPQEYGLFGFPVREKSAEQKAAERRMEDLTIQRRATATNLNRAAANKTHVGVQIKDLEARLRGGSRKRASVSKRTDTLYTCRPLLNADAVIAHFKSQGLATTLEPEDMHVTVAYSKAPVKWPEVVRKTKLVLSPDSGREMKRLGKAGEAVVLAFPSQNLTKRWEEFREQGASWDHGDQYTPHVTISYRVPEDVDVRTIQPYDGPLVFGPERFEPVKEHAAEGYTEKMREVMTEVSGARSFSKALVQYEAPSPYYHCSVLKAKDEGLGLVFGWAIVSSENGEPYYDTQGDHIPEDSMLKAAAEFMLSKRTMKIMHSGKKVGTVVFAWPMTQEVAAAMGVKGARTGLMVAVKPDNPRVLERFRNNEYTGFSIGGNRLIDEEVD